MSDAAAGLPAGGLAMLRQRAGGSAAAVFLVESLEAYASSSAAERYAQGDDKGAAAKRFFATLARLLYEVRACV